MLEKLNERATVTSTLGQFLASIRQDRGLTLRDVETATEKEVSNAYLSQIENDKIKKPSPNVLLSLSKVYKISYERLMEMAGYVVTTTVKGSRHGRVATFAEHNLTEEEEAELMKYLHFIRSRK
jgi:HTH-type transcriptional regulator, competence development regulator